MFRFMPTASGNLHMGHIGNLCLIDRMSKERKKEVGFIIDDIQVRGWKMYDHDYTNNEIYENCESIKEAMNFLFPNFVYFGRFSDTKYELERKKFTQEYEDRKLCERTYFKGYEYIVPKIAYRETINKSPIFDVLKSFSKEYYEYEQCFYWNPFFTHEMIDKHLGTTCQVVDYNLYCPESYAYDDHTNSMELYIFWASIVGRLPYDIHTCPRIVKPTGEDLKKSKSDDYSVFPLNECWTKATKAYGVLGKNTVDEIANKIRDADDMNPFFLKEI